jgi:hypothetical protein
MATSPSVIIGSKNGLTSLRGSPNKNQVIFGNLAAFGLINKTEFLFNFNPDSVESQKLTRHVRVSRAYSEPPDPISYLSSTGPNQGIKFAL